jgi:hypothetical protein
MIMLRSLAIMLALQGPATVAQPPAPGLDTRGLFSDWRRANDASLAAESRRQAQGRRTVGAARTLGERVGELVASGDCEGGERMAREAGDFPLVDAVRDFCRDRAPRS